VHHNTPVRKLIIIASFSLSEG